MDQVALNSFAKVNLSLAIVGIRDDRFHEIRSEMQSVSVFDNILIARAPAGIDIDCDSPKIPEGEGNIAWKAAGRFFDFTGIKAGASITIRKNIPVAAGLAGGSSNAAATLLGLDKLFNAKLSSDQISSLGAEVGSDVPFCLTGGRCMVRGRGEIVGKLSMLPKMWFVIVVPDIEVSTKWAYEEYDRWNVRVKAVRGVKEVKGVMEGHMHNDLEEAISAKFPVIGEVKSKLITAGAIAASMSGSGPAVFGICAGEERANKVLAEIKKEYPRAFAAGSVNSGVEFI